MAPSRKSRQPETPTPWKLPMDLLLEIVARSNHRTIVRCAATCRLLRRDILSPPLDRRVVQASPRVLAFLRNDAKKPLALVHPTTGGGALSFCHKHLPRFMSRKTVTLLDKYKPVSSRHGFVVLRRIKTKNRPEADRYSDMCVYDPMSGIQTFFSDPREIQGNHYSDTKYVVLTAADGIDNNTVLLLDFDPHGCNIKTRNISLRGTWEHAWYVSNRDIPWGSLRKRGDPTILYGGVLHWLTSCGKEVLCFDLGTTETGSVKLPPTNYNVNHLYLATSSDRKLLKLLAIQGFTMFVWLQLPVSAPGDSGWSLETVIDMEEKLRSLDPRITDGPNKCIVFEGSGKRTGGVVFLVEVTTEGYRRDGALIVFDLEMKKMHRQKKGLTLLEIDLSSRLQTMKIFS